MMAEKKRGRPLKPETLESKKAAENMLNRPAWSTQISTTKQAELNELISSMDRAEKEIIAQYKYSQTTSVQHAYAMASLGDESMNDFEEALLKRNKRKRSESSESKKMGADAVKKMAAARACELCQINKILLERLKPLGPLSMSDVAKKILKDWDHLDPSSLLLGEPRTLRCRGLPGKPPSAKTIASYIKKFSPFHPHRVGKTSLGNK